MLTLYASLLSLLPVIVAGVPDKCGSGHPTFTLDPINYRAYWTYTAPSVRGPGWASISFTLRNDETDYAVECSGTANMFLGYMFPSQTFDCTTPGGSELGQSSFSFDTERSVIALNSTWECGGNVVYKTSVSGTPEASGLLPGSGPPMPFMCDAIVWENPDWVTGQMFQNVSIGCWPSSLVIQL